MRSSATSAGSATTTAAASTARARATTTARASSCASPTSAPVRFLLSAGLSGLRRPVAAATPRTHTQRALHTKKNPKPTTRHVPGQLVQQQALVLRRRRCVRACRVSCVVWRCCRACARARVHALSRSRPAALLLPPHTHQPKDHFDLSVWAFEKLADKKWGVIGALRSSVCFARVCVCVCASKVRRRRKTPSSPPTPTLHTHTTHKTNTNPPKKQNPTTHRPAVPPRAVRPRARPRGAQAVVADALVRLEPGR